MCTETNASSACSRIQNCERQQSEVILQKGLSRTQGPFEGIWLDECWNYELNTMHSGHFLTSTPMKKQLGQVIVQAVSG